MTVVFPILPLTPSRGGELLPPGFGDTLIRWFDAADVDGDGTNNSAYSEGGTVTTWVDKGTVGSNVTQATEAIVTGKHYSH